MLNNYLVDQEYIKNEQSKIDRLKKYVMHFTIQDPTSIGDSSNYISCNQMIKLNSNLFNLQRSPDVYKPIGTITKNGYAYLYIPDYLGSVEDGNPNVEKSDKFAFIVLNLIQALSDKKPKGWVFDLRANTDGIIYAFILSFLAVLDEFEVKCVDKNGVEKMKLIYNSNELMYKYTDRDPISIGILPPIKKIKITNVNILVDNNTASCGELLTYLLKKQHNATIYGYETYGVASWMEYYDIPGYDHVVDDLHIYYPEYAFDFSDSNIKLKKNIDNPALATKIVPDVDEIPFNRFLMFT
jgi:C-terminal processing protease CtpA/Prc